MADRFSREELIDRLEESHASMVRVAIADIDGVLRGKYMHMAKLMEAVESGFTFGGGVLARDVADRDRGAEAHAAFADAIVEVDPSTFRHVPWDNSVPFLLGQLVDDDREPLVACPRQLLKKVVADLADEGFVAKVGMEFEFFNFFDVRYAFQRGTIHEIESITTGNYGHSVVRASQQKYYLKRIMDDLEAFGVPIAGLHTLSGPGAYEVSTIHNDAVAAADHGVLLKTGIKEIAHEHGITPTFMAKWNPTLPGSGCRIHQSLWSDDGETNVLYDETRQYRMSSTFESFLAGQLLLLPELMPFLAPTVNSYKRLLTDDPAPNHATWGTDHQAPALRVIPTTAKNTRLENRVAGADINPYLAIAAALGSGLYGIRHRLTLNDGPTSSAADRSDAPQLPRDLLDATRAMRMSERAREIFGEAFIDHFADTRAWEWQQYQASVSDWEVRRYFEVI